MLLVFLLFIELLAFSLVFDANSPELSGSNRWFAFLAYAGDLGRLGIVFFAAILLISWKKIGVHLDDLRRAQVGHRFAPFLWGQLLAFIALFICSANIFGSNPELVHSGVVVLWLLLLFSSIGFWLFAVAPWRYWQNFVVTERLHLLYSLLVSLLAFGVAKSSQFLWRPLSELTFAASANLLGLFSSSTYVEYERKLLGMGEFVVNIARACSGFEGIGLVVIFTTLYLGVYRREFRFPQALLLFPIGIIAIWSFNVLRIVLLIWIGETFSEAVAVGGFHSQAGWIFFLIVIFSLLILAHRFPFFSRQTPVATSVAAPSILKSLPSAVMIPFVVLMASVIVTSAFSAEFVWLYPLRVIAVGIALVACWRTYDVSWPSRWGQPLFAGALVFLIWILLVPNNAEENQNIGTVLTAAPSVWALIWLVFRVVGAVVTVPLAEELVFRGYLFSRLAGQKIRLNGKLSFSWRALLISSILFGILHASLFAGFIAGLIYGWVRYRSESIVDAVVAHSVTNLLLALYVIGTQSWAFW